LLVGIINIIWILVSSPTILAKIIRE